MFCVFSVITFCGIVADQTSAGSDQTNAGSDQTNAGSDQTFFRIGVANRV